MTQKKMRARSGSVKSARVISRATAKMLGLPRYFTGKICRNGHIAERSTPGGNCLACWDEWFASHRKTENEKKRRWVEANLEKRRAASLKWWDANREAQFLKHRDTRNARARAYRAKVFSDPENSGPLLHNHRCVARRQS